MSQPPHESQARQNQTQQKQQSKETYSQQAQSQQAAATTTETITRQDAKVHTGKTLGIHSEPQKVTKGRNGESNVAIVWGPTTRVDGSPWYAFALTCAFEVKTLSGNPLEVTMEQLQYRKTHVATGSLRTPLIPVAPIGTKGKVIARDTSTGETVEQPWIWRLLGFSLWQFIKKLLLRSD